MTDKEKEMLQKLKKKEADEKKEQAKKQRQFKDMCKKEFGITPTEILALISNDKKMSDFEQKVTTFYKLENELDKARWIDVMCNEHSKSFWNSKRTPNGE